MTRTDDQVQLADSPPIPLQRCARALAIEGFKNIRTDEAAMMVTGEKRPAGQWTKAPIALFVEPASDGAGSQVTITSSATAQSLVGLASSPSGRLVSRVKNALQAP